LTPDEWNGSHPDQCQQYIEAWKAKEKRKDSRNADTQYITAVAGGVKISGRSPRISDFMPVSAKKKINPALSEARLRVAMESMAAAQNPKKTKAK
tara:strand:- start:1381 stop:1665 length:285 start_codon:yes stop_codon:yes gene_type:complete